MTLSQDYIFQEKTILKPTHMKTKILVFIAIYSLIFSSTSNEKIFANSIPQIEDSICIVTTPNLYNLTTDWINEYCRINPNAKIKINTLSEALPVNALTETKNLFVFSDEFTSESRNESLWRMVIGLDAIVPVINANNPFIEELYQQGVATNKIAQVAESREMQNWSTVLVKGKDKPISLYLTSSESTHSDIAKFLKIDNNRIKGISLGSDTEIISAIQKDIFSIGFCKVSSIIDPKSHEIFKELRLLPIDKNGNGKIDYSEKIYDDLGTFLRGVWIGKYSKELCNSIYITSSNKPSNQSEIAFLEWVVTNGQQYMNPNGFSDLTSNQKLANIKSLRDKEDIVKVADNRSALPIALIILVACTLLFFAFDSTLQHLKHRNRLADNTKIETSSLFNEDSITSPDGLYFDKSHTWAFMEKDGLVGIGIDDFLQHITGPITRIKMKQPGENIRKGEPFLTLIQEGKQLNLKSPISGTIKTQNTRLTSDSSLVNKSPYNEGWIYTVDPTNWLRDAQFLIFAKGYKEWIKLEFLHLKDFLAVATRANNNQLVFQDGGEIKDGILKDLKPEIWEDFQTHFLDSSK
jgi:glycine cleavage system H lipoate-binding protein/ABC-type phosphate transport system substrate-binding protein